MGYKAKPAMAAWIQRERKRLKLSTGQLVDRLAAIGVTVSRQTIQVWESNADRRPSAYNLDALERIFASQAPGETSGPADLSALVAAIAAQTEAMRELVSELRAQRSSPEVRPEAVAAILEFAAQSEFQRPPDPRPEPEPVSSGRARARVPAAVGS